MALVRAVFQMFGIATSKNATSCIYIYHIPHLRVNDVFLFLPYKGIIINN